MGRLTLNVLLSFARFEREVTGERSRNKIAASKRKGIWVGGIVPFGYGLQDRKLVVDETEAPIVRQIFARYLALGSLPALQRALRAEGIVTRHRVLRTGTSRGGVPLTNGPLQHILRNRVSLGELNHRSPSHPAKHAAIIEAVIRDHLVGIVSEGSAPLGRTDLASHVERITLRTGQVAIDRFPTGSSDTESSSISIT